MVGHNLVRRWVGFLMGVVSVTILACALPGRAGPTPPPTALPTAVPSPVGDTTPGPTALPSPTARPTRQPTLPPLPTPTYDPQLADWSVFVYVDADNNLEMSGLLDINEMEAAGTSDRVNVIAQIDRSSAHTTVDGDWSEARRYRITADQSTTAIDSELLLSLGEIDMGDPDQLRDFLVWGIENYPANRYALVLWDHGAGWIGIAYDDSADDNALTLTELDGALTAVRAETGLSGLDVIAFDACLMGQLDVFDALASHANYVVGSEELTPAQGWDYTALLERLYAAPQMDGATLATHMVTAFHTYYQDRGAAEFVTMSAVDLRQVGLLTTAVEQLAVRLAEQPQLVAGAVGDARSGAEMFARVYPESSDFYAAIDLHHFAAILAERSPDPAVQAAAVSVMGAIETAVVAAKRGTGFQHARGVSVYFPRQAAFLRADYGAETGLRQWPAFLDAYYSTSLSELPSPAVYLEARNDAAIGYHQPAYLEMEIVGREIDRVIYDAGRYDDDGRRRLFEYDLLYPEPSRLADGTLLYEWRDGVHDDFLVWNTAVTYLFDEAGNGDFVVMWPTAYDSLLYTVAGRYRAAEEAGYVAAQIVFDHADGRQVGVWGVQSDASGAPAEIVVSEGDEFQVLNAYLDANDHRSMEPGQRLFFDAEGTLAFDWRPLPSGTYFLRIQAENIAGATALAGVDYLVENEATDATFATYLDPFLGFQFDYEAAWERPDYDADFCNVDFSVLCSSDPAGTSWLYVTPYPEIDPAVDADALKRQTLAQFGDVAVVFEEEVMMGGFPALLTAYTYAAPDGSHTGIFLALVADGTGFVIDVDGPGSREAQNLAAAQRLASSWQFRPIAFGRRPGRWATAELDAFALARPTDFAYQLFNGWERFSAGDGHSFVAIKAVEAGERSSTETVGELIDDAANGVNGFSARSLYAVNLAGRLWQRVDFSFTAGDGVSVWGYIMVTPLGDGRQLVAWAEAPSDRFNEFEQNIYQVMIADLVIK